MSSVVHDSILIYITLRRIAYLFMHVGHGSEPTTCHKVGNVGKQMDVRTGCTTRARVQQKLTQNKQVYSVTLLFFSEKSGIYNSVNESCGNDLR
jgi:hypothetical protein